jgi:hypothetical protein
MRSKISPGLSKKRIEELLETNKAPFLASKEELEYALESPKPKANYHG